MKIYLAADHRGFELKEKIKLWLKEWEYEYEDMGAFEFNKDDDYPDFVRKAAEAVANDPEQSRGIILGGSGQGEAMVANRYKGVRAAVFYGPPYQFKSMPGFKWTFIIGLLGRGGIGMSQKLELATLKKLVSLSREHNDSNVLSLGASFIDDNKTTKEVIKLWLETSFSGAERHQRRIAKF